MGHGGGGTALWKARRYIGKPTDWNQARCPCCHAAGPGRQPTTGALVRHPPIPDQRALVASGKIEPGKCRPKASHSVAIKDREWRATATRQRSLSLRRSRQS
jgi:hypothetical protein